MGGGTLTRLETGQILHMVAREARPGVGVVGRLLDELVPLLEDPSVIVENMIHFFNEGHTQGIDYVLERYSEMVNDDRKLVMSVVGSLGDLVALLSATSLCTPPKIASIKSQIFSMCIDALQYVDERDIPTVVRTLLLSFNSTTATAALQSLRTATQKFTVADMIPILPVLYNAIRLTPVLTSSWLTDAKQLECFSLLDLFFLLMIINSPTASHVTTAWEVMDAALERRAIPLTLLRIFVLDSSLLDSSTEDYRHQSVLYSIFEHLLLSTNPVMSDYGSELGVLLFVCIPSLQRQVIDTLLYASSQLFSSLHSPLGDSLGRLKREPGAKKAGRPSSKPPSTSSKPDDSPANETLLGNWSYFNWRYPLRTLLEICTKFGKSAAPFSQLIEDAMLRWTLQHGGAVVLDSMSHLQSQHWLAHIHTMAFCLAALVPFQSQLLGSLFILFQKQTSSGYAVSQICGMVLAQHLLHSAPLEPQDRTFLIAHLLRVGPSMPPQSRIHLFELFYEVSYLLPPDLLGDIHRLVQDSLSKMGLLSSNPPSADGVRLMSVLGFQSDSYWDVQSMCLWMERCHSEEGFVYPLELCRQLVMCLLAILSRLDAKAYHQLTHCALCLPSDWADAQAAPRHLPLHATVAQMLIEAISEVAVHTLQHEAFHLAESSTRQQPSALSTLARILHQFNAAGHAALAKARSTLDLLIARTNQASELHMRRYKMRAVATSRTTKTSQALSPEQAEKRPTYSPPSAVALAVLSSPPTQVAALDALYQSCTCSLLMPMSAHLPLPTSAGAQAWLPSVASPGLPLSSSPKFSDVVTSLDLAYSMTEQYDARSRGMSAFALVVNSAPLTVAPSSCLPDAPTNSRGHLVEFDVADPTRSLLRDGCGTGASIFFGILTQPDSPILGHIVQLWSSVSTNGGARTGSAELEGAADHLVLEVLLRIFSFSYPVDHVTFKAPTNLLQITSVPLSYKLFTALTRAFEHTGLSERDSLARTANHLTTLVGALLRRSTDAVTVTAALYLLALLLPFDPSLEAVISREALAALKKPLCTHHGQHRSSLSSLLASLTSSMTQERNFKPPYPDKSTTPFAVDISTFCRILHHSPQWSPHRPMFIRAMFDFMLDQIALKNANERRDRNSKNSAQNPKPRHDVFQSISTDSVPYLCFNLLRQVLGSLIGSMDKTKKRTIICENDFAGPAASPLTSLVTLVRQCTLLIRVYVGSLTQLDHDADSPLSCAHLRSCLTQLPNTLRFLLQASVEWRIQTMQPINDDLQPTAYHDAMEANDRDAAQSRQPPAASVSVLTPIFTECWNLVIEIQALLESVRDDGLVERKLKLPVTSLLRAVEVTLDRIRTLVKKRHVKLSFDAEPNHQVYGDKAFWRHLILAEPLPEAEPMPQRLDEPQQPQHAQNGAYVSILEMYGVVEPPHAPATLNNFEATGPVNVLVPRSKGPRSAQATVRSTSPTSNLPTTATQALQHRIIQPYIVDDDEDWSLAPPSAVTRDNDDSDLDASYEDKDDGAEEATDEDSWDSQDIEQDDLYQELQDNHASTKKRTRADEPASQEAEEEEEEELLEPATKRRAQIS